MKMTKENGFNPAYLEDGTELPFFLEELQDAMVIPWAKTCREKIASVNGTLWPEGKTRIYSRTMNTPYEVPDITLEECLANRLIFNRELTKEQIMDLPGIDVDWALVDRMATYARLIVGCH